jgi:26S proteasome regulatory subunit N3
MTDGPAHKALKGYLPDASPSMDVDVTASSSPTSKDLPEAEMYLRLLLIHYLLSTPNTESRQTALRLAKETVGKIQALNRRTMDPIGAKIWWAYGRAYEVVEGVQLAALRPYVSSILSFIKVV